MMLFCALCHVAHKKTLGTLYITYHSIFYKGRMAFSTSAFSLKVSTMRSVHKTSVMFFGFGDGIIVSKRSVGANNNNIVESSSFTPPGDEATSVEATPDQDDRFFFLSSSDRDGVYELIMQLILMRQHHQSSSSIGFDD